MKLHPATRESAGFTIVELMIATVVFSVVLLIITAGVLSFTSSYYKGINSSNTQAVARTIMQNITQDIQFSGQNIFIPKPADGHFCVGGKVYMYTLGKQFTGAAGPGNWGLYEADATSGSCGTNSSGGAELLGQHMRLADISIIPQPSSNLYKVSVVVAYGDSDLLCSPMKGSAMGGCQDGAPSYAAGDTWAAPDMTCKLQAGSQFCAVSTLSTAVVKRVE